jgi:glycine dehydrogenase
MNTRLSLAELEGSVPFSRRHIGPGASDQAAMLAVLGYESLSDLASAAVPESILMARPLDLPDALPEIDVLAELREMGSRNRVMTSMIGLGYHGTHTPQVVLRKVLENPAWYTAYTPYQPEISQGRLEALLNFQTMVADLTGLPLANASMLDEATAAAEAMTLARRASKVKSDRFLVDADALPQTIAVIRTRAEPIGIEVVVADLSAGLPDEDFFGVLVQYPGASGRINDLRPVIQVAQERGAIVCAAADLLALVLLTPPGELGADVVIGTSQRFGVPVGFGGPHAGYMAVRAGLERAMPGRLVGLSIDADGAPALRLALQTREQHIRREKATSNICTAQVLLAVMASMYAVYHGREGLELIARRVHRFAVVLAQGLRQGGLSIVHDRFFDTIQVRVPFHADAVVAAARKRDINLRRVDADTVGIAVDEVTERHHIEDLFAVFRVHGDVDALDAATPDALPAALVRSSDFLSHPVFTSHRSETQMLRYLRKLSGKDVALDRSMIPLGSCTMKLNATTEMQAVTWPEFASIHPFAPLDQADGYLALITDLERWLVAITGYDAVSLQPNAGSQGELAGLLAIRGYHRARGDVGREVCLIPSSAHGTNAASAVMAGMRVVVIATDVHGNVDVSDLEAKIAEHGERIAAMMITYPSTFGVYEQAVSDICAMVHDAGGQMYVDGANLNALVGLAQPGKFGADVSHLNLHKTFCIPHGGGGPGVGPVAVRAHLRPHLPNHPLQPAAGPASGPGPVSAAPWGSAGILPISWAYIRLMGPDGLRKATQVAILNANYIARRLSDHYPVLYTGQNGLVAHECIIDLRGLTKETGVTVDDVAKRLIDYGFHAPTMSFPVAGTLMIEPTESEDRGEIDRFCEAMVQIRSEIDRVAAGEWPADDNPLCNAPHTAEMVTATTWTHAYPREVAAYPVRGLLGGKYWPPVRRLDGPYGDRHLVCTCPPIEVLAAAD